MKLGQLQAKRHLAAQVKDPALRERLTPGYTMGCKRILLSDDYYPALQRPNVTVVSAAVTKVEGDQVIDAAGGRHTVDCIVLATGFKPTEPIPFPVTGRGGLSLAEAWKDGMTAHLGVTVHGFPNLFLLVGPNTAIGHTSLVFMIECQLGYAIDAVDVARRNGWSSVEVKAEVQRATQREIAEKSVHTVWKEGGCRSWYLDDHGHNTTLWPDFTFTFWWRTRHFFPHDHLTSTAGGAPA